MWVQCTNCGSGDVQKAAAAYEAGTSRMAASSRAGYVSGYSQTDLARRMAPPFRFRLYVWFVALPIVWALISLVIANMIVQNASNSTNSATTPTPSSAADASREIDPAGVPKPAGVVTPAAPASNPVAGTTDNQKAELQAIWHGLALPGVAVCWAIGVFGVFYNFTTGARRRAEWRKLWYCRRCGEKFLPQLQQRSA